MAFSKEEIQEILAAIQEAYESEGRKLVLGELITEEGTEILLDNRTETQIN